MPFVPEEPDVLPVEPDEPVPPDVEVPEEPPLVPPVVPEFEDEDEPVPAVELVPPAAAPEPLEAGLVEEPEDVPFFWAGVGADNPPPEVPLDSPPEPVPPVVEPDVSGLAPDVLDVPPAEPLAPEPLEAGLFEEPEDMPFVWAGVVADDPPLEAPSDVPPDVVRPEAGSGEPDEVPGAPALPWSGSDEVPVPADPPDSGDAMSGDDDWLPVDDAWEAPPFRDTAFVFEEPPVAPAFPDEPSPAEVPEVLGAEGEDVVSPWSLAAAGFAVVLEAEEDDESRMRDTANAALTGASMPAGACNAGFAAAEVRLRASAINLVV